MTGPDNLIVQATPWMTWAKEHVALLVGVAVALLVAHDVQGCRVRRALEVEVTGLRSGAALRAKGELVVDPVDRGALKGQVQDAEKDSPVLAGELAAVPEDAKVVGVIRATTAPRAAHGKAAPVPAPTASVEGGKQEVPAALPVPCLLFDGQKLVLKPNLVELEEVGARMLRGDVSVWRVDGAASELLLDEPIARQLSEAYAQRAPAAEAPRAGFAPLGGAGSGGWYAGALAVTRPLFTVPLVRKDVAIAGVAVAGPGGLVVVAGPFMQF